MTPSDPTPENGSSPSQAVDFAGRTVIVTGAGAGIGRAEALLFGARGANVVVNDIGAAPGGGGFDAARAREVVDLIMSAGGTAVASLDDVSSVEGGESMVRTAVETFGDLDVLVNNAGVTRHKPCWELTEEDWDVVSDINLKGTFCTVRAAVRHWRSRTTGNHPQPVIVNTTSDTGVFGQVRKLNYVASKAGIHAMTIALARELGELGVRVNEVAPVARTRLAARALELSSYPSAMEADPTDPFDLLAPDHVAAAVCWLASDACRDITGRTFRVQGGQIELVEPARRSARIESAAPWTVESIIEQQEQLFAAIPADLPPYPSLPRELERIRASISSAPRR